MLAVAEILTNGSSVEQVLAAVETAARAAKGELIESQVTSDHSLLFAVIEGADLSAISSALSAERITPKDLAEVRLVGAELEDVKKLKPAGQYLVEWDFPADLTMERYLSRKREKSPLYDSIEDVTFLRTYVREDLVKCLCFYDGESEDAVLEARRIVDTPVSRIHSIESAL